MGIGSDPVTGEDRGARRRRERGPGPESLLPPRGMHADEVIPDGPLVGRLIASQFPRWAELPIAPVASAGTDNALFRLGEEMVVRLPRIDWAVEDVDKEHRWLPHLAPRLLAAPLLLDVFPEHAGVVTTCDRRRVHAPLHANF